MLSWGRSINAQLKNQSSIMLEDYEEFISLTLRTRSSRKPLRMQEENWKHQWLQPCFVRLARKASMGKPVARLMISSLSLHVSWKSVESTRMRMEESLPKYHEDHIAGKRDKSLQHYNLVHKYIPMPQAMKIPAAKAAVDKRMGETWKDSGVGQNKSQKTNQRWSMKQGRRAQKYTSPH